MTATRRHIFSGSPYEEAIGYARAVVDGDWIFVSGTTGFDDEAKLMPEAPEAQATQALKRIATALTDAGASLADVVRVRYILPNPIDFAPCFPVLRAAFGAAPPAATMMVAGLIDPDMKIEIEVTARRKAA